MVNVPKDFSAVCGYGWQAEEDTHGYALSMSDSLNGSDGIFATSTQYPLL